MNQQISFWVTVSALILIALGGVFFVVKHGFGKLPYYMACGLIPLTHLLIYQIDIPKWGNVLVGSLSAAVLSACLVFASQKRDVKNELVLGLMGAFMAFSCLFVCVLDFIV